MLLETQAKTKINVFTSNLLNVYDIPGPKLGQPSTNTRLDIRKAEPASTFK